MPTWQQEHEALRSEVRDALDKEDLVESVFGLLLEHRTKEFDRGYSCGIKDKQQSIADILGLGKLFQ